MKHYFLIGKILFKKSNSLISVIRILFHQKQWLRGGMLTLNMVVQTQMMLNTQVVQIWLLSQKTHNCKLKLCEIAEELKISEGSVFTILHEHLSMRKLGSKWVHHLLTVDQKQPCINDSKRCLQLFQHNKKDYLHKYLTMNETWTHHVKVTYLGIRSTHERVWLVEWKPIWLPRAYLTRGDLEPATGNLHVCKFLRDLTIIQIRTVTAEWAILFWVHLPDECVTSQGRKEKEGRKEGENLKEREKEGRRTREKVREKEQLLREREKALDSIRPETNTRVLSWINTRISFLLPFTPALDNTPLPSGVKSAVSWVDSSRWKLSKVTKDTNISRQGFGRCILGCARYFVHQLCWERKNHQ